MTPLLYVVVVVVGTNPLRRRLDLAADRLSAGLGATGAALGYVVIAVVADPVLDAIDVSPPNARIAAGFVVLAGAIVDLARRPDPDAPSLPGRASALVPAFFPILFRPDMGALALAGGASPGAGWVVVAFVIAAVATIAATWVPTRWARTIALWFGPAVVGVALVTILDGVFDV